MGIRTTDNEHVAIYDSVSDWAFGPVFESEESAQEFLDWCSDNIPDDIRRLTETELESAYKKFLSEYEHEDKAVRLDAGVTDTPDDTSLEDLPI